jgi:hypothetical protein
MRPVPCLYNPARVSTLLRLDKKTKHKTEKGLIGRAFLARSPVSGEGKWYPEQELRIIALSVWRVPKPSPQLSSCPSSFSQDDGQAPTPRSIFIGSKSCLSLNGHWFDQEDQAGWSCSHCSRIVRLEENRAVLVELRGQPCPHFTRVRLDELI